MNLLSGMEKFGFSMDGELDILADEKKAHIPIVAMTANAFEEDRKEAFKAGMDGHLSKPIDIRELMRGMAKVFR